MYNSALWVSQQKPTYAVISSIFLQQWIGSKPSAFCLCVFYKALSVFVCFSFSVSVSVCISTQGSFSVSTTTKLHLHFNYVNVCSKAWQALRHDKMEIRDLNWGITAHLLMFCATRTWCRSLCPACETSFFSLLILLWGLQKTLTQKKLNSIRITERNLGILSAFKFATCSYVILFQILFFLCNITFLYF